MPAFTKPDGGLIVVFSRDGEAPEERRARDAADAAVVAIRLLTARLRFDPGDVLLCRRADDPPVDLPAVSRSSHYS
jgi:hypothetical protein